MINGEAPAGKFFCRLCLTKRDFVLCDPSEFDQKNPAIECYVCGYEYHKNVCEVDICTGKKMSPNMAVRPALKLSERRKALALYREEFQRSVLGDGYRLENFNGIGKRGGKDK